MDTGLINKLAELEARIAALEAKPQADERVFDSDGNEMSPVEVFKSMQPAGLKKVKRG